MLFQHHYTATTTPEDYRKRIETLNGLVTAALKKPHPKPFTKGCRSLSLCFHDGQRIRHYKSLATPWIAIYQAATNTILYKGKHYTSLSQFALDHYKSENPSRKSVDGWLVCEAEVGDKWVSTYKLPERNILTI